MIETGKMHEGEPPQGGLPAMILCPLAVWDPERVVPDLNQVPVSQRCKRCWTAKTRPGRSTKLNEVRRLAEAHPGELADLILAVLDRPGSRN